MAVSITVTNNWHCSYGMPLCRRLWRVAHLSAAQMRYLPGTTPDTANRMTASAGGDLLSFAQTCHALRQHTRHSHL